MNRLSYKRIGSGFPLVLVHGYLGGENMWRFQEDLEDQYELIMPSLAGYGESAPLSAPSTIRENANQVFALLDSLGIDKFNLLGHSMGGMIVQEMAVYKPERVNRLICLGTGPMGVLPNRFETIDESRRKIINLGLDTAREHIAKTWFIDPAVGDGYGLCIEEGEKATKQAALASLDAWDQWDGRGQLGRISSPTLVIWAREDRSYDWQQQQLLLEGIPDSQIEIVEGCAHNAHMEQPDQINSVIRGFLG